VSAASAESLVCENLTSKSIKMEIALKYIIF